MIFLLLKILRFLIGLVFKVVLFPFKLAYRLVSGQSGGADDEFADFEDPEVGGSGAADALDGDFLDVGPERAAKHVVWFRWSLLVAGAIQLVFGLIILTSIGRFAGSGALVAGLAGTVFAAVLPLLVALVLPRRPTGAWYAGMGLVTLQVVGSLFMLPAGLVWIAVYGAVGYLGYTGRPALGPVYGDGAPEPTSTPDQATDADSPASVDARESIERADETASTSLDRSTLDAEAPADDAAETADATGTTSPVASSATTGADVADAASAATETVTDGTSTAGTSTAEPTDGDGTTSSADEVADSQEPAGEAAVAVDDYQDALTASDPSTRATAVRDLADDLETDGTPDQAAIDALAERLDDDDPSVRSAACEALGRLGAERARPRLEDCRIDPDPDVSRAASRALRNMD